MKLMFVRHAEPFYRYDSLTLKGRREAELLALRLSKLDVKNFYVSPLGRAQETARHTLERMHRSAETLPWLAEYRGRCADPETGADRIPWDIKPRIYEEHPLLKDFDHWTEDSLFDGGTVGAIWQETKDGIDALLKRYGMVREENGRIYRCEHNNPEIIVLFCHMGISVAAIGYLLGISPFLLWHGFNMQPSSVSTLVTEERTKGEVVFRCMQLGDISHLYAADEPYSTSGLFPECYTGRDTTNPPEWDMLGYN